MMGLYSFGRSVSNIWNDARWMLAVSGMKLAKPRMSAHASFPVKPGPLEKPERTIQSESHRRTFRRFQAWFDL
jgi:hypothetical protein